MKVSIALFLIFTLVRSVPIEDQVDNIIIPGYTQHKWYSGYLPLSYDPQDGAFHYVFFQSQRDPNKDPLVLWLNGGPGCSSLIGMVYENGPFVFKPNTTNFQINEKAWNKKANLLYITSPQGVGFSYGKDTQLNDGTVAKFNLEALKSFFKKFPQLRKNDFYMTGQSYAGIYVPYLAKQILQFNKHPSSKDVKINLIGIMVGNACTDPDECYVPGDGMSMYQYQFLHQHTYLSDRQYDELRGACALAYHSTHCKQIRDRLDKKFAQSKTSILNIYNKCYHQPSQYKRKVSQSGRINDVDEGNCDDSLGIIHWFNEPMIQEGLHVKLMKFEQCSDAVAQKYEMFANASYWIYPTLIKENLRIWIYSGDVDADVPIPGTIHWLQKFREQHNLPVEQPWRQWWIHGLHKHEDQVAGMTMILRGMTFASIKGAGHEVPRDKRPEAYILLQSFLKGQSLPQKQQ